jgi:hypothetical protein
MQGTCLNEAALYGKTEVVKLLLDVSIFSSEKETMHAPAVVGLSDGLAAGSRPNRP